ncbi:MAG: branched-chain amino acid ABC transporter permease, partial [Anaerolineae bacterium]
MAVTSGTLSARRKAIGLLLSRVRDQLAQVPLLGWLFGALIAVVLEQLLGLRLAWVLGLERIPLLFGFAIMLKQPALIPSAILYVLLVYVLPTVAIAWLSASLANRLAGRLLSFPLWAAVVTHLAFLYAVLHVWSGVNDYRVLVLRLILISIMLTLSLNVVNGYMGEFSCSHPGFMA